mmetsp:Transcript_39933/g.109892  ORF Transcript_39933/g.109892 Transcript_39933/m.109892 type:complete len:230 (-) Transcript_39933:32-721(-)
MALLRARLCARLRRGLWRGRRGFATKATHAFFHLVAGTPRIGSSLARPPVHGLWSDNGKKVVEAEAGLRTRFHDVQPLRQSCQLQLREELGTRASPVEVLLIRNDDDAAVSHGGLAGHIVDEFLGLTNVVLPCFCGVDNEDDRADTGEEASNEAFGVFAPEAPKDEEGIAPAEEVHSDAEFGRPRADLASVGPLLEEAPFPGTIQAEHEDAIGKRFGHRRKQGLLPRSS